MTDPLEALAPWGSASLHSASTSRTHRPRLVSSTATHPRAVPPWWGEQVKLTCVLPAGARACGGGAAASAHLGESRPTAGSGWAPACASDAATTRLGRAPAKTVQSANWGHRHWWSHQGFGCRVTVRGRLSGRDGMGTGSALRWRPRGCAVSAVRAGGVHAWAFPRASERAVSVCWPQTPLRRSGGARRRREWDHPPREPRAETTGWKAWIVAAVVSQLAAVLWSSCPRFGTAPSAATISPAQRVAVAATPTAAGNRHGPGRHPQRGGFRTTAAPTEQTPRRDDRGGAVGRRRRAARVDSLGSCFAATVGGTLPANRRGWRVPAKPPHRPDVAAAVHEPPPDVAGERLCLEGL